MIITTGPGPEFILRKSGEAEGVEGSRPQGRIEGIHSFILSDLPQGNCIEGQDERRGLEVY